MVMGSPAQETEVVVIGGGPGGYVAAIRAADLGKEVLLVDSRKELGGVCLIEGCIPSKTLIHVAEMIHAAADAKKMGLTFGEPKIDVAALRQWKQSVVGDLTKGVAGLLKKRGVEVVHGHARFENAHALAIEGGDVPRVKFRQCILATGSRAVRLPDSDGLGIWSAADALDVPEIPGRLLVIGGGYIGLELGLAYAGFGSKVTVVEMLPQLLTGCDPDLVQVVARNAKKRLEEIYLESKVLGIEKASAGYAVRIDQKGQTKTLEFDRILASIGRRPNTDDLGLEKTSIVPDGRGFIAVDETLKTSEPSIQAIGDITHGPMLAHRASAQGKVAAEVIAGHPAAYDARAVPAVVFTDPEIAWTGLTEAEASAKGIPVKVGKFPLSALGRAKSIGRTDGFTKVLIDPETKLVLGAGFVGAHASDMVAEATFAIEMGATVEDLAATIHPHPTLSESLMEAAEVAMDAAVHIFVKK